MSLLSRNWGVYGADGCRLGHVGECEEGHTPTGSPVDGAEDPCPASEVLGATGSEAPSRPEDRAPRLSLAPRETGRDLSPKGVRTRALVYVTESLFMAWKRRTSCHCFQKNKIMENFWQEQRKRAIFIPQPLRCPPPGGACPAAGPAALAGLFSRPAESEGFVLRVSVSQQRHPCFGVQAPVIQQECVCAPQCCPQFPTKHTHTHTQTKQPLRQGPKRTPLSLG